MTEVNSVERILIADDMKKRGVERYEVRPGNDCVWVSYGRINAYYIFREGKIADIIYD